MARVKVPDSIKIGGHKYKISFDKLRELADENNYGDINHRRQRIRINPDRPESQRREAFIHEILHCVAHTYGGRPDVEESLISTLSEGLNQMFDELGIQFDWRDIKKSGRK